MRGSQQILSQMAKLWEEVTDHSSAEYEALMAKFPGGFKSMLPWKIWELS